MAFSSVQPLNASLYTIVDSDASAEAVSASGITVYCVEIDNTGNSVATYTKLYNSASPTVGTTAPTAVLKAPALTKTNYPLAAGYGFPFGTALAVASVTAGGTAGSTGPTNSVQVKLWTN